MHKMIICKYVYDDEAIKIASSMTACVRAKSILQRNRKLIIPLSQLIEI